MEVGKKFKSGFIVPLTVEDLGPKYKFLQDRQPVDTYPKLCQAIWSAPATQKIGKLLGFDVHLTVSFNEFMFNGKSYSDRLGNDALFCELAALKL